MSGTAQHEWRRTLNGKAAFELEGGKIFGINLSALLQDAQSKIANLVKGFANQKGEGSLKSLELEEKKWGVENTLANFTTFDNARASFQMTNGLVSNSDLMVTQKDFTITGQGNINIVDELIAFHLAVQLKHLSLPIKDELSHFLLSTPLPINVQGSLFAPSIRPDLKSYTQAALRTAQKAVVKDAIHKGVNKALEHLLKPKQ